MAWAAGGARMGCGREPGSSVIGMAVALLIGGPVQAGGFEFAGFRSGMSPAQVQAAAPLGYELRMLPDSSGAFTSGALVKGDDFYAQVGFCNGRIVHVIRNFAADTDWLPTVRAAIQSRGQPQVMVLSQPWSGPGGGYVGSLILRWSDGQSRYELSVSPEGRDGKGALRYNRSASESHFQVTGNPCAKP
jgi:hypothetical protein